MYHGGEELEPMKMSFFFGEKSPLFRCLHPVHAQDVIQKDGSFRPQLFLAHGFTDRKRHPTWRWFSSMLQDALVGTSFDNYWTLLGSHIGDHLRHILETHIGHPGRTTKRTWKVRRNFTRHPAAGPAPEAKKAALAFLSFDSTSWEVFVKIILPSQGVETSSYSTI